MLNEASRLSLAGTQNKVGLAHRPGLSLYEGWLRPLDSAGSTHILKVSSRDDYSYFEFLCMRAARSCGIKAAATDLLKLTVPVVCSERFDRIAVEGDEGLKVVRRHQEDFAQAFGLSSASKYAELAGGTLRAIARLLRETAEQPIKDIEALARLACFNYLIGNCDNHLKNLSLLYSEDWFEVGLAPAYDLVCTTWFPDLTREMGAAIGGVTTIDNVVPVDVQKLASELEIPARRLSSICSELAECIVDAVYEAVEEAPDTLDEVSWKAEELVEDLAPRRDVLARV